MRAEDQQRLAWTLGVALVLCVVLLAWALPRSWAYDGLIQENLALKAHLREMDDKLSEVDRILLRLRVYDAQLSSLAPAGDHGPVAGLISPGLPMADGEPMEPISDPDWEAIQEATGLRPAEAWASHVAERATLFVSRFEAAELDLTRLAGNLEELRALESAMPVRWPAVGDITSRFGWRHNPMGGRGWDHHSGVDISNKRGTPIFAPSAGKVTKASYNQGYGRMVEIDHGFGIKTVYAHCHVLRVAEGDLVQGGDLIALMGSTGRSTGPHLHYEVRIDGHAVDPRDYMRQVLR